MRIVFLTVLCLTATCHALEAEPRRLAIGLAVGAPDQGLQPGLRPVLHQDGPGALEYGEEALRDLFVLLGRYRTSPCRVAVAGRRPVYETARPVAFVAHLIVHRFGKIYRNRIVGRGRLSAGVPSQASGSTEEVVGEPAVYGRCELRLVRADDQHVIWSGMRDTTLLVPCDGRVVIFNPEMYPGRTRPELLRTHLSGLVRLQHADPAVGNMLRSADIWEVSAPDDDAATARRLMRTLIAAFAADVDGYLPLTGSVSGVLPGADGAQLVILDLGARHGLHVGLRLDVQRPGSGQEKVGEIRITAVESTTATARVRKLSRRLRQRGGGVERGDIVISRRRKLPREWPQPFPRPGDSGY